MYDKQALNDEVVNLNEALGELSRSRSDQEERFSELRSEVKQAKNMVEKLERQNEEKKKVETFLDFKSNFRLTGLFKSF